MLDVLEKGGSKSCDLLKLIGKRRYTAVMQHIGNLSERKLIIDQQLFRALDLMFNNELLDGRPSRV